jgi:beta-barrel assembly-enhancing protease
VNLVQRQIAAVTMVVAPFLVGCQTTGVSKWIPANSGASDGTDSSVNTAIPSGNNAIGITDISFEIGTDPYAYADIPPGVRPAMDTREAGLWLSIDKSEEKSKTAGNRILDENLNTYLTELVCTMSGPYCSDVRVYIQRIPLFNATMAPNGMMSIYSGFLLRAQNEAQLSAVLGHEIGHYIRRHSIQRLEDAIAKQDFGLVFGMLAAGLGVPAAGDLMQLAMLGSVYSFSRDNEREADLIGINLMHLRGYDTREASNIWTLLLREKDPDTDSNDVSTSTLFASTHPSIGERIVTLGAIADKLQGPDKWGTTNKERFDRIVGPWKFQFLQDEVRLRNWKSSLELLNILAEYGHDKAQIAYFRGEVFRNRNKDADKDAEDVAEREADIDRALRAYEESIGLPDAPAEAYRAAGLIYLKKSNPAKAREALEQYLKLKPAAEDLKLIQYMMKNAGGLTS